MAKKANELKCFVCLVNTSVEMLFTWSEQQTRPANSDMASEKEFER